MHDSDLTVLLNAAVQVASYPPENARPDTFACLVPWGRLEALRAALDRAGIVWTWGQ